VKFLKALLVFLAQFAVSLILFWLMTRTIWIQPGWIYRVLSWGAMPLSGMFLAYYARKFGVSNYLAWIAPPLAVFVSFYLTVFFTPTESGPTLLTAFFAIVGAAAAEVRRMQKEQSRKKH